MSFEYGVRATAGKLITEEQVNKLADNVNEIADLPGFQGVEWFQNPFTLSNNVEQTLIFGNPTSTVLTWWNVSNTTRITVPAGIKYVKIRTQLTMIDVQPGSFYAYIRKNNDLDNLAPRHFINGTFDTGSGLRCGFSVISPWLEVVEGDYFELVAFQLSGDERLVLVNASAEGRSV